MCQAWRKAVTCLISILHKSLYMISFNSTSFKRASASHPSSIVQCTTDFSVNTVIIKMFDKTAKHLRWIIPGFTEISKYSSYY